MAAGWVAVALAEVRKVAASAAVGKATVAVVCDGSAAAGKAKGAVG